MGSLFKRFKRRPIFRNGELGMTLVEILVALAILGIVAPVFLGGAATALKAAVISQERVAAESLAKSQMESIRAQPYGSNYALIVIPPELQSKGYNIVSPIYVERLDASDRLQKVTVTVTKSGKQLLQLTDYKVKLTN